jgi:hypothetical protein
VKWALLTDVDGNKTVMKVHGAFAVQNPAIATYESGHGEDSANREAWYEEREECEHYPRGH